MPPLHTGPTPRSADVPVSLVCPVHRHASPPPEPRPYASPPSRLVPATAFSWRQEDIGVKTAFQCDLSLAVDSLGSLALCATPMDKMLQVKARTGARGYGGRGPGVACLFCGSGWLLCLCGRATVLVLVCRARVYVCVCVCRNAGYGEGLAARVVVK